MALREKIQDFLDTDSGIIGTGAALGAVLAFGISFEHEYSKRGFIPLAFSEIGQTRRCIEQYPSFQITEKCGYMAQKYGPQSRVPALTDYFSAVNDTAMMVFEAQNQSIAMWREDEKFAYELEKKTDPSLRIHTQIPEYAARSKELVANARGVLQPMLRAEKDIDPTIRFLDDAWDESHNNIYKTVIKTRRVCSGDGKTCRTETYTVQEYSHTIHTYNYDRASGQQAVQQLNRFYAQNPDIRVGEKLIRRPWATEAENEMAVRDSRRNAQNVNELSQNDYTQLTATWVDGSSYTVLGARAYQAYDALSAQRPLLRDALKTAKTKRYITYSSYDDGPQEFQKFKRAFKDAQDLQQNVAGIRRGLDVTEEVLPRLSKNAQDFVNAVEHGRETEKSPNELHRAIMKDARLLYRTNFTGGFDVEPSKWWATALWTFLGGLGGAGFGFAGLELARRRIRFFPANDKDYQPQ